MLGGKCGDRIAHLQQSTMYVYYSATAAVAVLPTTPTTTTKLEPTFDI